MDRILCPKILVGQTIKVTDGLSSLHGADCTVGGTVSQSGENPQVGKVSWMEVISQKGKILRTCSLNSVGRVSPLHGEGRGFKSLSEHK
jgi:hypothetical protein